MEDYQPRGCGFESHCRRHVCTVGSVEDYQSRGCGFESHCRRHVVQLVVWRTTNLEVVGLNPIVGDMLYSW